MFLGAAGPGPDFSVLIKTVPMKTVLNTLLFATLLCTCGRAQLAAQQYEITVHPGQEMMTIIQVLAERYANTNDSDYQADVMKKFKPHADHPAVKALQNMSDRVYSDFPELGWCLTDFPQPDLYLPDSSSWYDIYPRDSVQKVLRLAREFADDTDFWSFYQAHKTDYRRWGTAVEHALDSLGYIERLDQFYAKGTTPFRPKFYIALDPLNGWGAHALPELEKINPYYLGYKGYSLGYWNRESTVEDSPSFSGGDFLADLIWHEGSHVYLNQVLKSNQQAIDRIAYLFNGDERKMQNQNIDTWGYCFEENLVRGIVIALSKQHRSHRKYREQKADELLRGFLYAEDIADWLETNYLPQSNTKSLTAILPGLVNWLDQRYDKVPK